MTEARLHAIFERFGKVKAAVIGDVCLDAYWHADMRRSELSRETPHYNRPVYRERYSGGALANVAANLAALGVGKVAVFTILGRDWRSGILLDILKKQGIDTSGILLSAERLTPAFLKPILEGYESSQEAERFDFLTDRPPEAEELERLAVSLEESVNELDCVLCGDQVLDGVMTPELAGRLSGLAGRKERTVFTADSRYKIQQFRSMVWKPNDMEASKALGISEMGDRRAIAGELLAMGASRVFMTVGEEGCVVADSQKTVEIPGFRVQPPLDIVGAGDAFHSITAVSLAAGCSSEEAGFLGNMAAAVTVAKVGITGTASQGEILDLFRNQTQ
ncbi:MAG TPA: PfkB family carbohydrate kinase [Spirochaetia bacterium]|nr:PfkB family carbohydrate kinase [Spirochaetia bacterium]